MLTLAAQTADEIRHQDYVAGKAAAAGRERRALIENTRGGISSVYGNNMRSWPVCALSAAAAEKHFKGLGAPSPFLSVLTRKLLADA